LGRKDPDLEEGLFMELLAYGLCRVRLRLDAASEPERGAWLTALHQECARLLKSWAGRRRSGQRWLKAALQGSETAELTPELIGADRSAGFRKLTPEMFEQFCKLTGLDARVLVGKGENLASLVFYISIHGVVSARRPLRTDEAMRLLRSVRDCRADFDKSMEATAPAHECGPAAIASPPVAALPPGTADSVPGTKTG
jgi:hypothetical protein